MAFIVYVKVGFMRKSFVANVTFERLNVGVNGDNMFFQVMSGVKCLLTLVANKVSLVGVAAFVGYATTSVTKPHPTERARVWLHPGVGSFMPLMRRRIAKRFIAERARKRLISSVNPFMILHIRQRVEFSSAEIATKLHDASMSCQVEL
jgi:ABC-type Co2+ transport system permease subunit